MIELEADPRARPARRTWPAVRMLIAVLVFPVIAGCLFGGRFGEDNPPCQGAACTGGNNGGGSTASSVNQRVYAYLQDWYLWYDQLPAVDPDTYPSVSALVTDMRYRPAEIDRFSYVDTVANYTAFFEEGTTIGYGFGLSRMPDNTIRLTWIEPGSPAEAAVLLRGLLVLTINGFTTTQLDQGAGGGYEQQIASPVAGIPLRLQVTDGTTIRDVTLVSAQFRLRSVWQSELVTPTLAYLFVKQFIATTRDEIRATFAQAGWADVTDLIVDLRYNGGGRISESSRLVSHVLGAPTAGQLYSSLQYNARHRDRDTQFLLGDGDASTSYLRATAPRRVIVITSSRTCSASEEAIAALRSFVPAANFFIVGPRATCGKPFGFEPRAFQVTPGVDAPSDPVVSAVNFRAIAADGTTDYTTGLAPTCVVTDDLTRQLADPAEGLRAAARLAAESGACPVTASANRVQPQSVSVPAVPDPIPAGVKALHGGW